MSYKIQQLGIGGILDQSISLIKNHFGLLFQIVLILLIPWVMIGELIQVAVMPVLQPNAPPAEIFAAMAKVLPIIYANAFIMGLVLVPLANAAVMYAVAELYLGKSVSAKGAVKYGLKRILPLIWTTFIGGLAVMGGTMLCVVPGILFALWFGLSQNVVVLEGLSGTKALGRSKTLVRPYLGTFLVLGVLVMVIAISGSAVAALIPQPIVKAVVASLISGVTVIFTTATFAIFYFSCRCGVENFDLEHLANAVNETPTPSVDLSAEAT